MGEIMNSLSTFPEKVNIFCATCGTRHDLVNCNSPYPMHSDDYFMMHMDMIYKQHMCLFATIPTASAYFSQPHVSQDGQHRWFSVISNHGEVTHK